jgi:hypothetical protein
MAAHTNTAAARKLRSVADELAECIRWEVISGRDPQYVAGLQFATARVHAAADELTSEGTPDETGSPRETTATRPT